MKERSREWGAPNSAYKLSKFLTSELFMNRATQVSPMDKVI